MVMMAPPIGPTTRPPSKPIRNAPSSERSAKRYAGLSRRRITPTSKAGTRNSISLNFWSGSRSSVNSTRRNVFHLASSAAIDEATPTFSNKVKSSSWILSVPSMASWRARSHGRNHDLIVMNSRARYRDFQFDVTVAFPRPAILDRCDGQKTFHKESQINGESAQGGVRGPADTLRPVHNLRLSGSRRPGRSHCPSCGNLNGHSTPLVRVHSQCLTGDVLTS